MALTIRTITLQPEADEVDFEKFLTDELLPAARSVVASRLGMFDAKHIVAKSSANDRTYLWITDLMRDVGDGEIAERSEAVPLAVGVELRAKLQRVATLTVHGYETLARSKETNITTPTHLDDQLMDSEGWLLT